MTRGTYIRTRAIRRKNSLSLLGHIAWNRGLTGLPSYVRTQEIRQKNSVSNRGENWVPKIRKRLALETAEERSKRISELNRRTKTGVPLSEAHRQKLSCAMLRARRTFAPVWNKGLTRKDHPSIESAARKNKGHAHPFLFHPRRPRAYWYYGKHGRMPMRSTWEVAYAKYLDSLGVSWLYEAITFVFQDFSYTPDFYLREEDVFVEIKGYFDVRSRKKILEFRKRCLGTCLAVLTREHLVRLGVLSTFRRCCPKEERRNAA
jgi:hypothetical protein